MQYVRLPLAHPRSVLIRRMTCWGWSAAFTLTVTSGTLHRPVPSWLVRTCTLLSQLSIRIGILVQRHGNACTGLMSKMTEHDYCTASVAQNSLHHIRHPQLSQIGISLHVTIHQPFTSRHVQIITNLTAAHENNGLSGNVGHGKRSTDLEHRSAWAVSQSACGATHLVIDSVPLGN